MGDACVEGLGIQSSRQENRAVVLLNSIKTNQARQVSYTVATIESTGKC